MILIYWHLQNKTSQSYNPADNVEFNQLLAALVYIKGLDVNGGLAKNLDDLVLFTNGDNGIAFLTNGIESMRIDKTDQSVTMKKEFNYGRRPFLV